MRSTSDALDAPLLAAEPLARRVAAGDAAAFRALFELLWDPCLRFARAQSALRGASEDDVREVVTRFIAKLGQDEHRALQLYLEWATRHPEKTFADWLKIALSNAARDYGRALRGSEARAVPGEPSAKRLLNELAKQLPLDDVGVRPPVTDAQTARQVLEFAQRELPQDQRTALLEWLQGASFEMIAETSALPGPEDAKRLVRAAVAVLRRQFG